MNPFFFFDLCMVYTPECK